jgi:hypothetical protein
VRALASTVERFGRFHRKLEAMNQNTETLTPLTENERAENAQRLCGVEKNATQTPYREGRCRNPVAWLWTNNGGHTQSGNSTLLEIYWCEEHVPKQ